MDSHPLKKKKEKSGQLTNLKAGVYKPNKRHLWMEILPVGYQFETAGGGHVGMDTWLLSVL